MLNASAVASLRHRLAALPPGRRLGRVTRVGELGVESAGPAVALGELCELRPPGAAPLQAEVVAIEPGRVLLMPYAPCHGLAPGAEVVALDAQPQVAVGDWLLGQVVDAFAVPLSGVPRPAATAWRPLLAPPLNPLDRAPVDAPLHSGIRVVDALLPIGRGQRVGLFSGSGVGKSSLLGMLARNVDADVVVVALIGERGREVNDFLHSALGGAARRRSVVVVATAEQPAVVRVRAALAATAIAEHFREQGQHVLLLMDSITRFAMARREIDLAAGQPPTTRGYTPSVFSALPALCERCGGIVGQGSITAVYAVLVEGDDPNEAVSDALRSALDGHVALSRELANDGHHPAVDVLHSVSRLEAELLAPAERERAHLLRARLAAHRRQREMVDMGLYKPGMNPVLDAALERWEAIEAFLRQRVGEVSTPARTRALLDAALGSAEAGA